MLVENDFWICLPPPPKKIGYLKKYVSKMKKMKVVQNCLKWRENLLKMVFGLCSLCPKKFGGCTNKFCQKLKKWKLFKIAWNVEKIGRKLFLDFLAPPTKKNFNWGGVQIFLSNEKNQSCSELPEMARKLVENNFLIFSPPLKKTKNLNGRQPKWKTTSM